MSNQAGIELLLSAPGLKPIMSDIVDSVEELTQAEKDNIAAKVDLRHAQEELQSKMKAASLDNQKYKDIVKQITDGSKENANVVTDQTKVVEKHRAGILSTIKAYFEYRSALKESVKQMQLTREEIFRLEKEQASLSKSARTNADAYKQFNANQSKIEELTGKLKDLKAGHDFINKGIKETENRYAFLGKALGVVKNIAVLAFTAVAALAVAGVAAIAKIVSQSDFVEDKFKVISSKLKDVKNDLINALAPIGIGVADGLLSLINSVGGALDDSKSKIFDWAAQVGAYIFALAKSLPFVFDHITKLFAKLGADIDLSAQLIKSAVNIGSNPFSIKSQLDAIETAKNKAVKANQELADSSDKAALIFRGSFDLFINQMEKMKDKILEHKNLTKEDLDAIKKLREEYDRLTESIRKQIEALNVKEAGPFAGVLLKAELAAKAIEMEGEKAVILARRLGRNQKEVQSLIADIKRLAEAVREDAVKFLTDQADTILDSVSKKLEDIKAKQSGTEGSLKLSRDIAAQFKEFQIAQGALQAIIDKAQEELLRARSENRIVNEQILKDGLDAATKLAEARAKFSQLKDAELLEFNKSVDQQILEDGKKAFEKQLADLKEKGEQLKKTLTSLKGLGPGHEADVKEFQVKVRVNDIDIAVAAEKIKQFEAAFEVFKKTGKLGEIETDAVIRTRVENSPAFANVTPNVKPATKKQDPNELLTQGLNAAATVFQSVYSTINDIVTRSVDIQIEAINRLNETRDRNIDNLQKNLDREAIFKANGLANDYEITKKQLANELKLKEESSKKAFELAQKRAKLQRAQDDAASISAIIASIANIFQVNTKLNPFGVFVAIAQSAVLLAAFAAAKLSANKVAKAYKGSRRLGETFGEFAPGERMSDAPGYDRGLKVIDRTGRLRGEIGGDEFMHKESVSKTHRKFFTFLNENEHLFKNVNLLSVFRDIESVRPVDLSRITNRIEKHRERMTIIHQHHSERGISKKDLEQAVNEAMNKHAQKMIEYHESRPDVIPTEWLKDHELRNSKSKKHIKTA